MLREALSNAARHASASQVDVTVDIGADGMLTVQVTDNGRWPPGRGRRSGLRNLADRAEKLGGELRLEPADRARRRRVPGWNGACPAQAGQVRTGAASLARSRSASVDP